MATRQQIIDYLNSLVDEAIHNGARAQFFPQFTMATVTDGGVRGAGEHEYQGRQADKIKAAVAVCDAYLQGRTTTEETLRKRYRNFGGPGISPDWLESLVSGLNQLGVLGTVAAEVPTAATPITEPTIPIAPATGDVARWQPSSQTVPDGWLVGIYDKKRDQVWVAPAPQANAVTDAVTALVNAIRG